MPSQSSELIVEMIMICDNSIADWKQRTHSESPILQSQPLDTETMSLLIFARGGRQAQLEPEIRSEIVRAFHAGQTIRHRHSQLVAATFAAKIRVALGIQIGRYPKSFGWLYLPRYWPYIFAIALRRWWMMHLTYPTLSLDKKWGDSNSNVDANLLFIPIKRVSRLDRQLAVADQGI